MTIEEASISQTKGLTILCFTLLKTLEAVNVYK